MQNHLEEECLIRKVEKQEREAEDFGFYWESFDQLIDQAQSECKEIQEAWEKGNKTFLEEEIGDLIQASISIAVFCKFDPRVTLQKSIDKFQKRYDAVVKMAKEDGHDHLREHTFAELMDYWNRAKKEA